MLTKPYVYKHIRVKNITMKTFNCKKCGIETHRKGYCSIECRVQGERLWTKIIRKEIIILFPRKEGDQDEQITAYANIAGSH